MKQLIHICIFLTWGLILQVHAQPIGYGDFVITVKTDNSGISTETQFTIPTNGTGYNYNVDCDDDGTNDIVDQTGDATCDYASAGTYTIRIKDNNGDYTGFPRIYFNNSGDKEKLLTIEQWGETIWTSMSGAFRGCSNLILHTGYRPNLSQATSMYNMFSGTSSLGASVASWDWDTSHIENMGYLFYRSTFNDDISDWNTSAVKKMEALFYSSHFNQDISTWDTSSVENMQWMFGHNDYFDQDISTWDTSSVEDMSLMFYDADKFNQNVSTWDVGNVTNFYGIFGNIMLSTFNYDAILIAWDKQTVHNGVEFDGGDSHYCYGASARAHLVSSNDWNITDGGLDCSGTEDFIITVKTDNSGTSSDTQFTIPTQGSGYNYNVDCDNDGTDDKTAQTGNVTCNYATAGIYTIRIKDNVGDETGFPSIVFNNNGDKEKILSIDQWGMGVWSSMYGAFYGCSNLDLKAVDVPNLSSVTHLSNMFDGATSLVGATANWAWDTSTIKSMYSMFMDLPSFNQDIGDWNTSSVTSISFMFTGDSSFNQDISGWDTSSVERMEYTFASARSFNQNIASWNIENVTHFTSMFMNVTLDTDIWDAILIAWDAQAVKNNVSLHGGSSHYCRGENARAHLISSDDWNITDGGKLCSPDYTPKIRLTGASTSGENTIVPVILTVTEIHDGNNINDIIVRIPRHDYISFVYNVNLVYLSKPVNNSDWELINHPAEYRFKYIGNNGIFTENSFSRIGLELHVQPESGSSGQIDFKIDIKPGTGDENSVNDSDSSQIDYTN